MASHDGKGATAPGPTIDEIVLADEPGRWSALGFALAGAGCPLGSVRLRFAGQEAGSGVVGWSLRGITSVALDGLPTARSSSAMRAPAPPQPNGVLAIDHVVAISPALDRSVSALQAAGLELRRLREEPTPAGAPRQAFFRLGEAILEVIQEPDDAIERQGGRDRPARFWGLALTVSDLERALEQMAPHAGSARAAVQPGRRIATLRRSAGLSIPLALMTPPA